MDNSVSVVIPTYNRARLVARAIKSAQAAMSPGDELLVIDDGSTDDTEDVVRSFGKDVRYFRVENAGSSVARNLGIRSARCPLVAMLDDDDEWLPDKLELQRKVMDTYPETAFCFSNFLRGSPSGQVLHDGLSSFRNDPFVGCSDLTADLGEMLGPGIAYSSIAALPKGRADFKVHVGDIYPVLMEWYCATNNTVMVRKDLVGASYCYDEDLHNMDDTECFSRVSRIGPVAYLDCELAVYVTHAGPRLTDLNEIGHMTTRISLHRRIWGADERFLRTHSARYHRLLRDLLRRRARLLIGEVRLQEAQQDLAAAGGPLAHRIVASLPPAIVEIMLGVKRRTRGLLKSHERRAQPSPT